MYDFIRENQSFFLKQDRRFNVLHEQLRGFCAQRECGARGVDDSGQINAVPGLFSKGQDLYVIGGDAALYFAGFCHALGYIFRGGDYGVYLIQEGEGEKCFEPILPGQIGGLDQIRINRKFIILQSKLVAFYGLGLRGKLL